MSDVDVEATEQHECCLCHVEFTGWGNNPYPLGDIDELCCDLCNAERVIPARLERLAQ